MPIVVLYLGLVNWIVTSALVTSEFTRPIREWADNQYIAAMLRAGYSVHDYQGWPTKPTVSDIGWRALVWFKARYLVGCQLCTGIWVGQALAILTIGWITPLGSGVLGIVLAGLLYKAIGHLFLILQNLAERLTNGNRD